MLVDRDDGVLTGFRFVHLRDTIGAQLLVGDVRAATSALFLPFPTPAIITKIHHDDQHKRFLIRPVWIRETAEEEWEWLDKEDNRRAGACHPGLGMLNRKTGFGLEDL